MPERFECTTLAKKRYINTLPFLFLFLYIGFVKNITGHCGRSDRWTHLTSCAPDFSLL